MYVSSRSDLRDSLFLSPFVACSDNDIVKGDFADKATLKYGTPIILALYPANVGIQAESRRGEVQYRVTVADFPHRGFRYVNSLLISGINLRP